ncbi:GNAT family N-acetyltransferase [Streptomyces ovatisporus]|uniref:GNAT family N-acetyltransferase n=1 Tax=Streptomyces ovatisporus TaxID=1128682 RepID=A0ABV9ABB2_9ACTN
MTDMSQNEQPSRHGFLRLVGGSVQDSWGRLRRRCASAAEPQQSGAGDVESPVGAGATSLWLMRTTVREEPGALAELCTALARERIDIVSLQTFPLGPREGDPAGAPAGAGSDHREDEPALGAAHLPEQCIDEFVLRAPREIEAAELHRLVAAAGGRHTWAERADEDSLVDIPTRVLQLATRTALDTAELPLVLRQLLGRCTIRSVPPVSASGRRPDPGVLDVPPEGRWEGTVLRLPDPAGGVLIIERPQLPFAPSEFARARALVELDRQLGAGTRVPHSPDSLTLPEGPSVTVRRADTRDARAALAMHERCSRETLSKRYHGPVSDADAYLAHLLSPRFGRSLAVETASGKLVALGHLLWDGDETEVALLVEDAWQHRGIGGELLRRLVASAVEAGAGSVYAVTQASNTAMVAAMRGLGLPLDYQIEEGTLVVTAQLTGAAPAVLAAACAPSVRD